MATPTAGELAMQAQLTVVKAWRPSPFSAKLATIIALCSSLVLGGGCSSIRPWEDDNSFTVSAEPLSITPDRLMNAVLSGNDPISTIIASPSDPQKRAFLGAVVSDSKQKCRTFLNRMSVAQNGVNTVGDITTTILSGIATVVTPLGTSHALSAASTIVGGTKATLNQDLWANAGIQDFQKALQTSYYAAASNYEIQLETATYINVALEIPKVQSIHDLCTLAAAKNVINSTLANPNPPPPDKPGGGGTKSVVPGQSVSAYTGPTGTSPVKPTPLLSELDKPKGSTGNAESATDLKTARTIEAALCLPVDTGTVTFGPQTRAALSLFRQTATGKIQGPRGANRLTAGMTRAEVGFLGTAKPCQSSCYRNAFEYFEFGPYAGGPSTGGPQRALDHLRDLVAPGGAAFTSFCDANVRSAVDRALAALPKPIAAGTPLTGDLLGQLEDKAPKPAASALPPAGANPATPAAPTPGDPATVKQ